MVLLLLVLYTIWYADDEGHFIQTSIHLWSKSGFPVCEREMAASTIMLVFDYIAVFYMNVSLSSQAGQHAPQGSEIYY